MHAKLDELVNAPKRARDEMAGIEELFEEKIAQLKENASRLDAPPVQRAKKTAARSRAAAFSGSSSD